MAHQITSPSLSSGRTVLERDEGRPFLSCAGPAPSQGALPHHREELRWPRALLALLPAVGPAPAHSWMTYCLHELPGRESSCNPTQQSSYKCLSAWHQAATLGALFPSCSTTALTQQRVAHGDPDPHTTLLSWPEPQTAVKEVESWLAY